jgi:hypothetical protein
LAVSAIGCGDSGGTPDMSVVPDLSASSPDLAMGNKPDLAMATGDAAMTPTCAAYCAAVTSACTGANVGVTYPDLTTCMTYCQTSAAFAAGMTGDTSGDTIGCRTYHAGAAAASTAAATMHCPHAGPSGGNMCGSWCTVYCDLAQKNCTGGNQLYANAAACMTACTNASGTAAFTQGTPGATSGNTVQCRIYHLGTPANTDPATHCGHGKLPTATGMCI